jgi:hypothetical protein
MIQGGFVVMKTIITVTIIAIIMLTGCSKPVNVSTNENTVQEQVHRDLHFHHAPLLINFNEIAESDFKTTIINEFNVSRSATENDMHRANKISEINEFYFPAKIDRFNLLNVAVDAGGFSYGFAPSERLNKTDDYYFCHTTDVLIIITRPYDVRESGFSNMSERLENIARANGFALPEDGLVYCCCAEDVFGFLSESVSFRIQVPPSMASRDYLRSLALDLISTAELVNVDEEIGRLAQ